MVSTWTVGICLEVFIVIELSKVSPWADSNFCLKKNFFLSGCTGIPSMKETLQIIWIKKKIEEKTENLLSVCLISVYA